MPNRCNGRFHDACDRSEFVGVRRGARVTARRCVPDGETGQLHAIIVAPSLGLAILALVVVEVNAIAAATGSGFHNSFFVLLKKGSIDGQQYDVIESHQLVSVTALDRCGQFGLPGWNFNLADFERFELIGR